ncbi:MAG: hypothetical protein NVSMB65_00820 [Chloroflexota bacterium]
MQRDLVPLLGPLALLLSAVLAFRTPGRRPRLVPSVAEGSALVALLVSLVAALVLVLYGPGTSPVLGPHGIGLLVRLDAVSMPMLGLVSRTSRSTSVYQGTPRLPPRRRADSSRRPHTATNATCSGSAFSKGPYR